MLVFLTGISHCRFPLPGSRLEVLYHRTVAPRSITRFSRSSLTNLITTFLFAFLTSEKHADFCRYTVLLSPIIYNNRYLMYKAAEALTITRHMFKRKT